MVLFLVGILIGASLGALVMALFCAGWERDVRRPAEVIDLTGMRPKS